MILRDGSTSLEIRVTDVAPQIPPHSVGGDVRLLVRLRCDDFAGATSGWVKREVWHAFIRQLEQLDRQRQGEAVLQSMSPDELRLRVFATDHAGHMAVDGQVRTRSLRDLRLQFGAVAFDPTFLHPLLNELQSAAPAL